MKILRLRFQNLNSLVGEWHIDFEHEDYVQNGLFAITGPTGAGKSTILDAICLGLFGETPRLANISKSENEIMSRHQAQCLAEVTFAVDDKIYRSTWSQTRARKLKTGKLQDSKHELADAISGNIIEDKKSRTIAAIEDITHLNFKRFTRSVLLAQGSFAAFLQASVDERSDMLQQITGTEIYETISKQVHMNKREAESQLQLLQAAANAVVLLDDDALQQIQQQWQQTQQDNAQTEYALEQTRQHIHTHEQHAKLHTQQQLLTAQWQAHEQAQQAMQADVQRLQVAEKAQVLQADFQHLEHLRQRQNTAQTDMAQLQNALPPLQEQIDVALTHYQKTLQQYQEHAQQTESQQKKWQHAAVLDAALRSEAQQQNQITAQQQDLKTHHKQQQQAEINLRQQCEQAQQQLQAVHDWANEHPYLSQAQKWLPTGQKQWQDIQILASKLESWQQQQNFFKQNIARHESSQHELQTFIHHTFDRKQQLLQEITQEEQAIALLLGDKTISEYQTEQDLLLQQQRLLHKIESLEAERQHLSDGDACPLCGATSHPYIHNEHVIPSMSATQERLQELDSFFKHLQEHERRIHGKQTNYATLKQQYDFKQIQTQQLQQEQREWGIQLLSIHQEIQNTQQQSDHLLNQLQHSWQEIGLPEHVDWNKAFEQLQRRIEQYQNHAQKEQSYKEKLALLNKDLEHLLPQLQKDSERLQQLATQMQDSQNQQQDLQQQRQQLLGTQSIEQAQNRWQTMLQDAQKQQEQQYQTWQLALNQLTQAQQRLTNAQAQAQSWQQELEQTQHQWQQLLVQHAFQDEAQWQSLCLSLHMMEALRTQQKQWEHTHIQLQQSMHHNQAALDALNMETLKNTDLSTLQQQLKSLQDANQSQNQRIGALAQQIQQQEQAKQQFAQHHARIQAMQQECQRWQNLYKLIGSSDGKKYRVFAQSLTFNHLVQQANRQLQKMNERYLLKQNSEALLQLDVIDQFQGNEVRSAKNLSGGESFIVSLALALGLSQLSGHNTRIESLFLDEGFGTLDEDALEVALNALASLQQDGKMIGIISHVAALKERISTQIQVEPRQGGVSSLRGSGISHLS
ncbi:AAA family ATPase [Vitreoscilla stercoraria]|uniref:AAA family ATPase n=1 Tax=Vitreoscilla stercoraria TaxID=61 RepID=A0ABY4EAY6_VITST|nr:AAA family ATPase [Vitreoscilla stercoraria]UOO92911.1 AAA family ATPase [Vitreoscilla stercoraria]